jgi:hypothetical protein
MGHAHRYGRGHEECEREPPARGGAGLLARCRGHHAQCLLTLFVLSPPKSLKKPRTGTVKVLEGALRVLLLPKITR